MGCASSRPVSVAVKDPSSASKVEEVVKSSVEEVEDTKAPHAVQYCGAPCALNEPSRIKHLHGLGLLDTAAEERYDNITKLCCMIFKVPIALVSLVDVDRQWFKSEQGLGGAQQTDRTSSFCAWTLLPAYPEALVVENALLDARFRDNPLVQGFPFIRFYAGCPLVASNGLRLGSLCIIDRAPRTFDAESCALLANMAEMVVREVEKDKVLDIEKQAQLCSPDEEGQPGCQELRSLDATEDAVLVVNTAGAGEWSIVYANAPCQRLLGGEERCRGASFWSVFQGVDGRGRPSAGAASAVQGAYRRAVQERRNFELRVVYSRGGGAQEQQQQQQQQQQKLDRHIEEEAPDGKSGGGGEDGQHVGLLEFRFAPHTGVDAQMPLIGIPNFLPDADEPPNYYFAVLRELGPAPGGVSAFAAVAGGAPFGSGAAGGGTPSVSGALSGFGRLGSADSAGSSSFAASSSIGPAFKMLPNNDAFADIRLGPLLGKGSFGRVYRAAWSGTNVAVKIIEYLEDESAAADGAAAAAAAAGGESDSEDGGRGRALLEGLLQERVSHPHVVRNFKFLTRPVPGPSEDGRSGEGDGGDGDGSAGAPNGDEGAGGSRGGAQAQQRRKRRRVMEAWLLLEFCNRGCIADGIDKGWFRLPHSMFEPAARPIITTAKEVAAAMAYLHSEGILHGDLTSANVLLTTSPEGEAHDPRGFVAKVSDFGLSRSVADEDGVIATRSYGTVTHMPPELLLEGRMSKAADVYSFGVVLWEMFQGGRPFAGLTHSQVLHAVSTGKTLTVPKCTPEAARPLLAACLSPKPEARPKFAEVLQALEELEELFPW